MPIAYDVLVLYGALGIVIAEIFRRRSLSPTRATIELTEPRPVTVQA